MINLFILNIHLCDLYKTLSKLVETEKKALKSGKIFSLGLDVYNGEPNNIHPEYLTLPNVFVLPHLGSATRKTRTAMADLAVDNIYEFFN